MTKQMNKSSEQLNLMLQDQEMLRDREMEQEMLRLRENIDEMSKNLEKSVMSMERLTKRLEEKDSGQ